MKKTALFIRHRAKPGQRENVRLVWEKHVLPAVAKNPGHEEYFYCFDVDDEDVICVFQLYKDRMSSEAFVKGAWYADYVADVSRFVMAPPQVTVTTLEWSKNGKTA